MDTPTHTPQSLSDWLVGEPTRLLGNVHTVERDTLYRSATLHPDALRRVVDTYSIRTVLNLRGAEPGERWYREESACLNTAGVHLIDFPMVDYLEPSDQQLSDLRGIFTAASRPLLVHCRVGADRTGLVCALFELWIMRKPADTARRQLSWRYGHVPWLDGRSGAMDRAFRDVAAREAQRSS